MGGSMSKSNYVFPTETDLIDGNSILPPQPGMELRDYFAGVALIGLLSGRPDSDCGICGYTQDAYRFAIAMMKAREEV
jgi:hypothetical protein